MKSSHHNRSHRDMGRRSGAHQPHHRVGGGGSGSNNGNSMTSSSSSSSSKQRSAPVISNTDTVSKAANLEIISAENFQRRLEGMSSCADCMKQKVQEPPGNGHLNDGHHSRKRRRGSQQRLNSPIVVRLEDTIKVSIKGRAGRPSHRADQDSDHSTSFAEDALLASKKEVVSLNNICQMSRSLQSLRDDKNFNAFLSAIERVHFKEHDSLSANLEEFVRTAKDDKALSSQVNFLNNAVLYHNSITDKEQAVLRRSLEFLDKDNVELICNDLSSKNSVADSEASGEDSENSSIISSTDSPSDTDASSESLPDELSGEELERLAQYATGPPLTRYDCTPHECPECLAAYYAYTSSYWYGNDCSLTTSSDSDLSDEDDSKFTVRVVGEGKVEVSVGPLNRPHRRRHQQRRWQPHPKQRPRQLPTYMRAPPPPALMNSVYVDLTELDVSLNVEYHQETRDNDMPPHHRQRHHHQQPQMPHQPSHHHHYHAPLYPWEWLGGGPWGYQWGSMMWPLPYFLLPVYYIPYPLVTMPKPLCVPRKTKCLSSQRLCMVPAQEIKNFTASEPPQRPWIPLAHPERNKPVAIFTVMCYNVLCDKYATRQLYAYCPSWALNWEYRKKGIIEEIRHYSTDIITLQEVETDQFYKFFLPELKNDGYDGIFSPKSRARTMTENERKHVDGCAIFFRTSKFALIKEHLIEFNRLAMSTAEGSHDMLNRVMTKDNIGLAALLETKEGLWENGQPPEGQVKQPLLVATCHVHWDPEYSDVKLIQTMMLMHELRNIIQDTQTSLRPGAQTPDCNTIPLILCGDLNSLPESGVVEYLTSGRVSAIHEDFKEIGYETTLEKLSMSEHKDFFTHLFKLSTAYTRDDMPYTNYTYDFKGIIDYVFYSKEWMRPLGVLGPMDQDWFGEHKVLGCPHPHVPSDHLPILVELELQPTQQQSNSVGPALSSQGSSSSSSSNAVNNRGPSIHMNTRR